MGRYSPPLQNEVSAGLVSGYAPPDGLAASATLTRAGPYKYAPSLQDQVDATLVGGYVAPVGLYAVVLSRPKAETGVLSALPLGFDSAAFGFGALRRASEYIAAVGISEWSLGSLSIRNAKVTLLVTEPLLGRSQARLGVLRESFQLTMLRSYRSMAEYGYPRVRSSIASIGPYGIGSPYLHAPEVREKTRYLTTVGWSGTQFGSALVDDTAIKPTGLNGLGMGAARIFNWVQISAINGYDASLFGTPLAIGGVRLLEPLGLVSSAFGGLSVTNTRAEQRAAPDGIAAPALSQPTVSPSILYAAGIHGTAFGYPVVQFPPQPIGWQSSTFGYAIVEYKTKTVAPTGYEQFAAGFPDVRDRAQYVQHSSQIETTLFGDLTLKLVNARITAIGFDSQELGSWAEIRSLRRWILPVAIAPSGVGEHKAVNKTPSIATIGFSSLEWGGAGIGWRDRIITPSGAPEPFGQVALPSLTQTPSIKPWGFDSLAAGATTVWAARRTMSHVGTDMQRFGLQEVGYRWRKVNAEGHGVAGEDYGIARVDHSERTVSLLGGAYLLFGDAWLSYRLRSLAPDGIPEVDLSNHAIGGTRWVGPVGFEATQWLTRIIPENREIFPKTASSDSYGWPAIANSTREITASGVTTYPEPSMHWGVASVWNLRQVVAQEEKPDSGLLPPPWPRWTLVESRNKVLLAYGFVASHYGRQDVANNARLLAPVAIAAPALPEYQKTGSVTHLNRHLALEGIEAPPQSAWAVVWNKAVALSAKGFVATVFGETTLINLRRNFRLTGFETHVFGYPFVAYAVRELTFERRYTIEQPPMEAPYVGLYTRYVEPQGIKEGSRYEDGVGSPSLSIVFRRIEPRWNHRDLFGEAALRNLTPELPVPGYDFSLYGDANVRLQWRPIQPVGNGMDLWGLTRIADTRQTVAVPGRNFMQIGNVSVRRIGAEPIVTQYIDLRSISYTPDGQPVEGAEGDGIAPPTFQVGAPDLLKGYIFHGKPHPDDEMTLFGSAVVTANSIRVEPGYWELLVGEPMVSLKNRTIAAKTIGQLVEDAVEFGAPGSWGIARMSPHTIYAVVEAPQQATNNNAPVRQRLHYVNEGARVGLPGVSMYSNEIRPASVELEGNYQGFSPWGIGKPTIFNLRRYVSPLGTLQGRMGLATIPGLQTIEMDEPLPSAVFGSHKVAPPPYLGLSTIAYSGLDALNTGRPFVDFLHRAVRPEGFLSQLMGQSDSGPYNMPQSLHVGPPIKHNMAGLDASQYGEPWVSHRVREVIASGWDAFTCEYDYQNFKNRMRVRRVETGSPMWQVIRPIGDVHSVVGAPGVRPMRHYIRPDGNSEQYRKGAW